MKILFIGLGSIGQRHLQNLQTITQQNEVDIFAFRSSKNQQIIKNGKAQQCSSLANYYGIKEINDFNVALNENPDIAFVCNPSSMHIEFSIALANKGCHIFIEKPLATQIDGIRELENIIKTKNLITMVGFQARFHPFVLKIKNIIENNDLGSIISANFNWATYLPDHHPYEDYQKGYAARQDLGGGVINCLSHELDLIQFFCGMPKSVYSIKGGKSNLNMTAEDTVSCLLNCGKVDNDCAVALHLSFSQKIEKREFNILLQNGIVECDLQNNTLKIQTNKNEIICKEELVNFQRNNLFLNEIKHFMNCVFENKRTDISITEGKKSLKIAMAMHKSINSNSIIKINISE